MIGSVSSEYGHLLLRTYDLKKVFYGMGSGLRQNLDFSDFKRMPVIVPPADEQSEIARFLDHADTVANITLFAKEVLPRLRELNPEPNKAAAVAAQ